MSQMQRVERFFIKPEYVARAESQYFEDALASNLGIVHQPNVYAFAGDIARKFGCTHILDIGCGRGFKLAQLHPEFKVTGVDFGSNIDYCRQHYSFGVWLSHDLEQPIQELFLQDLLERTLVICSDVIEHLSDPTGLLQTLRECLNSAPVAILTTPERDLVRGLNDCGPPANPAHVREWNLSELSSLLEANLFEVAFLGLTYNNDRDWEKKTILSILHGSRLPKRSGPIKDGFRVVALMTAYNEKDIVIHSIKRLVDGGIDVYLIDNWSTDGTVAAVAPMLGKGVIGIERFPVDKSPSTYDWASLLKRVEELTRTITADWFIHHDVDEVRESPWPDLGLRGALHYVDQMGFNAVDHTVLDFRPVDNCYVEGAEFWNHFRYCEFGCRPGHFLQIKAWKNQEHSISIASSGGHNADFPGRRVFPYKFLLRHYPVRSQIHGERKVLKERKARFNLEERNMRGWHGQYDHIESGHNFLYLPESLIFFDPSNFYRSFLLERISGIGVIRVESNVPKKVERRGPIQRIKSLMRLFVK